MDGRRRALRAVEVVRRRAAALGGAVAAAGGIGGVRVTDPMRVLDKDEWYPVYTLERPDTYNAAMAQDYDEALIQRHDRVVAEFDALQEELSALWGAQHGARA